MPSSFGKRPSFGQEVRTAYARPQPAHFRETRVAEVAAVQRPWPLFTLAVALVLAAIYWGEVQLAGSWSMDFAQAAGFGGIDRHLVVDGQEWWRLFTAAWLHGSPDHLIGNLITLLVAGVILERHIGSAWLAACYLIGGIGGSIGSMALGDPRMVSVGASGAIMALVTMVYGLSYHVSLQAHAKRLRRLALFTLIPAIAPSAAHGAMMIDVGAHFGGFVVGLIFAFALLILWDEEAPLPGFRALAACVAIVAGAALTVAGVEVGAQYPAAQARIAMLVPSATLEKPETVER
ncbi:MAG: rhomboid family intramembrane serine protease, partial [Rhizomicrobium sp.]|nr:rhomboid family intramembrane serine protease [Rhizomicrobium sp.]